MSRGNGRLQRRIVELLEAAPERKMTRNDLDAVLVEAEGFDPSNTLRAVKGLARKRRVGFTDGRHKSASVVSLPREIRYLDEDEVFRLLSGIGDEG